MSAMEFVCQRINMENRCFAGQQAPVAITETKVPSNSFFLAGEYGIFCVDLHLGIQEGPSGLHPRSKKQINEYQPMNLKEP